MLDYQCVAWLVEGEDTDDSSHEAEFLIDVHNDIPPYEDVIGLTPGGFPLTAFAGQLRLKRNFLLHDRTSWYTVERVLIDINVPFLAHPVVNLTIKQCAQGVHELDHSNRVMHMYVRIGIPRSSQRRASEALQESVDSSAGSLSLLRADEKSMEALEKVKVKGFSIQCVICLEDMLVGVEAIRMPCSHDYHESCIKNWLQNSNLCPLCRYQMAPA